MHSNHLNSNGPLVGGCRVSHGFATVLSCSINHNYTSSIVSLFLSARRAKTLVSMAHTIDFFCHASCVMRNLLRVSVTAFLCGALMVLPATGTGVLADWPAGAIYPVTVLLDCSELRTGTICQTLSLMTFCWQIYMYIYIYTYFLVILSWLAQVNRFACLCLALPSLLFRHNPRLAPDLGF